MSRPITVMGTILFFVWPSHCPAQAKKAKSSGAAEKTFAASFEPIAAKYCFDCHADGMDKGDFSLDNYKALGDHLQDRAHWFTVWKNIRSNLMPPADKTQPSEEERAKMLAFIEREVFQIDPANPDPGAVTIRRLNREEYRYTIKDLLGMDFDTDDAFPADDTGYGFDTIGAVLSISPLLMEKYLDAAKEIVSKVVPLKGPQIPTHWLDLNAFKGTADPRHKLDWLPLDSARSMAGKPWVNHDGEYQVKVEFDMRGSNEASSQTGSLKLGLNGKELISRKVGWDNAKAIFLETRVRLKRGHENEFYVSTEPGSPPNEGENKMGTRIKSIRIYGPLDGSVKEYPWESRFVFPDGPPPASQDERDKYRHVILGRLASKAFRRPVDDATVNRLVELSRIIEEQPGKNFEEGIAHAVEAILVSPRFLMRAEIQPEPDNPGKIVPIDEYALASRLSYFLWSSCPDDELTRLATEGKLRQELRAQVDRMLADPKSNRFVENFIGQWLEARDVETININAQSILKSKDLEAALRRFNSELRRSMRHETEQFFAHVLKENRPATELLTANYTFLNEPLADWYGIPEVKGKNMRKVDLPPDSNRGGLLRQATFLVVTSNPTRTSPVKRGLFVLENFLATPAPPAVPDVPPLENSQKGNNRNLPLREILKIHSESALCASCHARMDPIGLALENYNPLGLWQQDYNGAPIDTSGILMTGESFKNAAELAQILAAKRHREFHRALAEKLMTFAVGRGMEFYDAPSIDRIVNEMKGSSGRLKDILYGVVESAPFQKRRGYGDILARKN